MFHSQESTISPMRYPDICVMLDRSLMPKLQLIGKRSDIKKNSVSYVQLFFFFLPSSLLMAILPVPLLSENHRNNNQRSLEKKLE